MSARKPVKSTRNPLVLYEVWTGRAPTQIYYATFTRRSAARDYSRELHPLLTQIVRVSPKTEGVELEA